MRRDVIGMARVVGPDNVGDELVFPTPCRHARGGLTLKRTRLERAALERASHPYAAILLRGCCGIGSV